jgi:Domain of unknown function (DUF4157)/Heterokaryon incompatibility protein Het-C
MRVFAQRQGQSGGYASSERRPLVSPTRQSAHHADLSVHLDPAAQERMEPRFGHDFSRVRVHTDAEAADTARAMHARAYTVRYDIAFGRGEYVPGAMEGMRLPGHELTHVAQQRDGAHLGGGVSEVADVHERNAEAVADQGVRGRSAEASWSAEHAPEPRPTATVAAPTSAVHPMSLQENAGHQVVLPVLSQHPPELAGTTIGDLQRRLGPGQPPGRQDREPIEAATGADLSSVRVHQGAAADELCSAFDARAFTLGTGIVVADGAYARGTTAARRLLAHELAHVVQQGARPAPPAQRLEIGTPADPAEREAESFAKSAVAPGPVPDGTPAPAQKAGIHSRRSAIVQRYLAGSRGHGGIEEDALQEAGLPPAEAKLAYYGNWLRDLSQIGDSRAVHEIIRVLATGEFGRTPTDDEIGHYLASEHMDRPDQGKTAEDPLLSPAERAHKISELTGEQRRWADEEQTAAFGDPIKHRAEASGLPRWIEASKEHAKREFAEAVTLGHNEAGLRALGNGLHAVEDYFAHSNFIEVAMDKLAQPGTLAQSNRLVSAMSRYIGVDPRHVPDRPGLKTTDRFDRPRIVTGTSVGRAATMVGMWETLKTELTTGELRGAFMRGLAIRYGWRGIGGAGGAVLGKVGGVIGGGLGFIGGALRWTAGTLGGLLTGAGAGAASAWHSAKHWWQKPFAALGGLFGGAVSGAVAGARTTPGPLAGAASGWRTGERAGGAVGRAVFGTAGAAIMGATGVGLDAVATALIAAVDLTIGKEIIPAGTRGSIKAAPYGTGPTHSQIAKDDPEHPLFDASRALAHKADVEIGRAIIQAWNATGPATARAASVQALVDVFVAHPYAVTWWEPILRQASQAAANPQPGRHPQGAASP